MLKRSFTWLTVIIVSLLCVQNALAQNTNQQNARPDFSAEWRELYEARKFQGMNYRLMKPIDLAENSNRKYPLILSLHGKGGRGTKNLKNLRTATRILTQEERRRKHPAFVVAPQTDLSWIVSGSIPEVTESMIAQWPPFYRKMMETQGASRERMNKGHLQVVFALLDALAEEFNIDTDRVYVLGHSMGGFGTWNAIVEQPDRFAAAIPSAGGLMPWADIRRIKDVPVWAFHGDVDPVVDVGFTRYAFKELSELKGNMKYTELKDVEHNAGAYGFVYTGDDPEKGFVTHYASDRCDKTPDSLDWLFAQKRK